MLVEILPWCHRRSLVFGVSKNPFAKKTKSEAFSRWTEPLCFISTGYPCCRCHWLFVRLVCRFFRFFTMSHFHHSLANSASDSPAARLLNAQDGSQFSSGKMSTFETCATQTEGGGQELLLQCISQSFEERDARRSQDYLSWLLVLCGALIFFMQVSV